MAGAAGQRYARGQLPRCYLAGRAGRDGKASDAWLLYGAGDEMTLRRFIKQSEAPEARKKIEHAKLDQLLRTGV